MQTATSQFSVFYCHLPTKTYSIFITPALLRDIKSLKWARMDRKKNQECQFKKDFHLEELVKLHAA